MAFGFGTGFLPTDPRNTKGPKGGSIKASQSKDSSVINTGDPTSRGIGFASPSAMSAKPGVAAAPSWEAQPKTAAEIKELTESRGVATTGQNMGSLAVDFRASEKAKSDTGEQTTTEKRATKVLDARSAAEHQRTVLEPASAEAQKFRQQAAGAKAFMGKFMASAQSDLDTAKSGLLQRSNSSSGILSGGKRTASGGASGPSAGGYTSGGNTIGPDQSTFLNRWAKDRAAVEADSDIMALSATAAHSAAPGTQAKDWRDMANAQSAGGKATPGEIAQAAASARVRQNPNK
jgi:hypothetical protein